MLGRLPWLAFERRMRALRFLVFFDIDGKASAETGSRHQARSHQARRHLALPLE